MSWMTESWHQHFGLNDSWKVSNNHSFTSVLNYSFHLDWKCSSVIQLNMSPVHIEHLSPSLLLPLIKSESLGKRGQKRTAQIHSNINPKCLLAPRGRDLYRSMRNTVLDSEPETSSCGQSCEKDFMVNLWKDSCALEKSQGLNIRITTVD